MAIALSLPILTLLACLLHLTIGNNTNTPWTEHDLHAHLFKTYRPDIIPKVNKSEPVRVGLEFYLIAIDNIDEKKQTIAVRAFMEVTWRDELLRWNRSDYSDVANINVKNEDLWLPDLSLTGTLGSLLDIGQYGGRAKVNSNGRVTMWPYKLYTIACKITVAKFPIDEQTCEFDFLSWTNPSSVIQLNNTSGKIDMGYMTESGEWEVASGDSDRWQSKFGSDSWDHLTFKLHLRRKWLFYALNMMTPVMCISLLNVLCFLLPAQSGERVTLCISIFLTLAVFLTVINSSMPESSEEVAVFGLYVGLQLIGSALTIFNVVLSIYFYHKDNSKPVPLLFRAVVKICCVSPERTNVAALRKNSTSYGNCENHDGMVTSESQRHLTSGVTWVSVSLALDRVCLLGAVCWHALIFLYLISDLNS